MLLYYQKIQNRKRIVMGLIIRYMTQEDTPSIQEITKTDWYTSYEGILPRPNQDNFLQNTYSRNRLMSRFQSSPFFVAKLNETLVCFTNFSNVKEE